MAVLTLDPKQVRPGDILTAIDHIELKPMTVDRAPATQGTTTVLHLEAPPHSQIEWQRYLEPDQKVTVERTEAAVTVRTETLSGLPEKALKPKKAYRLRRIEAGVYETADGRYQIEKAETLTYDDDLERETHSSLWVLNEKRDGIWQEISEGGSKRELTGRLDALYAQRGPAEVARRITRHGVRLLKPAEGSRVYRTEDGRFEIAWSYGYITECEASHPVRYTPEMIAHALSDREGWDTPHRGTMNMSHDARQQIRRDLAEGRRGYLCEGGDEHYYGMWELTDLHEPGGGDIVDRGDNMRDVLASLPEEYGFID